MSDLRVYYEDMGYQPTDEETSPYSTNFSQDLLSKEKTWGEMSGVEEAANMV